MFIRRTCRPSGAPGLLIGLAVVSPLILLGLARTNPWLAGSFAFLIVTGGVAFTWAIRQRNRNIGEDEAWDRFNAEPPTVRHELPRDSDCPARWSDRR